MRSRPKIHLALREIPLKDASENTTRPDPERPKPGSPPTDPQIRHAKFATILKFSLVFAIPYFYLILSHYSIDYELKKSILISAFVSIIGFFITVNMIPVASKYVSRRNLFGYDINKKGTPDGSIKVPESLGIVVGIVFLVVTILFQYFNFTADSNWLVEYNAALASICFMILLGFVDDVLDVPWRVKLVLPSIAALPLLMAYAGHTTIIIPKPLVPYVGLEILDLGWIYKLYMGLLAVFCTNSINIHAGINGLEVGQTFVIACAIFEISPSFYVVQLRKAYGDPIVYRQIMEPPWKAQNSMSKMDYPYEHNSQYEGLKHCCILVDNLSTDNGRSL
ncbi:UDP-n-acetylglucosamine--dolichyl-phosphate n-acetylglucosaminephosphotransferase [Phtheirospermum japonicum]|uniref:UDP-N-acetylglucosamine--dolichyl-phosphate N-acetylglucosaminephosphotransferase n=1 Tax=Phtheirospermum japonicum TaxID=374723 RepID=A0A830DD88_9LAMI|nr:UDP-n-acetylglucosamine--dolichyl-phosphate n-acetylglucosaminephosphotransferase [Phtheirospermum japonicum]